MKSFHELFLAFYQFAYLQQLKHFVFCFLYIYILFTQYLQVLGRMNCPWPWSSNEYLYEKAQFSCQQMRYIEFVCWQSFIVFNCVLGPIRSPWSYWTDYFLEVFFNRFVHVPIWPPWCYWTFYMSSWCFWIYWAPWCSRFSHLKYCSQRYFVISYIRSVAVYRIDDNLFFRTWFLYLNLLFFILDFVVDSRVGKTFL